MTATQSAPVADHVVPDTQGVQEASAVFVDGTLRAVEPPTVVLPVQPANAVDAVTVPSQVIQY